MFNGRMTYQRRYVCQLAGMAATIIEVSVQGAFLGGTVLFQARDLGRHLETFQQTPEYVLT